MSDSAVVKRDDAPRKLDISCSAVGVSEDAGVAGSVTEGDGVEEGVEDCLVESGSPVSPLTAAECGAGCVGECRELEGFVAERDESERDRMAACRDVAAVMECGGQGICNRTGRGTERS